MKEDLDEWEVGVVYIEERRRNEPVINLYDHEANEWSNVTFSSEQAREIAKNLLTAADISDQLNSIGKRADQIKDEVEKAGLS
jgi:hypothetical protein